jgi:heme/copper-type cytochrome/quinol oxidase subunit 1
MWPPPAATLVAMSGPRQTWTHVALWLGLVTAVVGTVVAVTGRRPQAEWFAYAPLAHAAILPPTNWQVLIGVTVAVVGAVVAAFAAGRLSVRRRR